MNSSLQDQLAQVRPLVKSSKTPSAARAHAEAHFQGDNTQVEVPQVDWGKCCQEEYERHIKCQEKHDNAELRLKEGDTYLRYAITGALTALTASCLFMLKQSCTNSDKSPKFTV